MGVGKYMTTLFNGTTSSPYSTSTFSLQFTQSQGPGGIGNQTTGSEAMETLPATTGSIGNSAYLLQNTWKNLSDLQGLSIGEEWENTASQASQIDEYKEEFFAVFLKHLDNYVLPVIILLGIVGNIISFTGKFAVV